MRLNPVRVVWRGLRDTIDQLYVFALASILWWLSLALVVTIPAATLTLFRIADPRHRTTGGRPSFTEALRLGLASFARSWRLALITLAPLLLVGFNLAFYARRENHLSLLAPLWVVLLLLGVAVTLCAYSICALLDRPAVASLRLATHLTGARMLPLLGTLLLLLLVCLLAAFLVVPFVLLGPALIATTVNRVVLTGLGLPIGDPDAPTPERAAEAGSTPSGRFRR